MSKEIPSDSYVFFLHAATRARYSPDAIRDGLSHIHTLQELETYRKKLGIQDVPTETVTIRLGTEGKGKPIGSSIPVYPKNELSIDETGFPKVLFNLKSLLGFEPPMQKQRK